MTTHALMNRLRTAARADAGSLTNVLVFVLVSTAIIGLALAFFIQRSVAETATAAQDRAKSSIANLSSNLLGLVNEDFPAEWPYMNAQELRDATESLGATPELKASSHISYFHMNPQTGVIIADMVGTPDGHPDLEVTGTMKLIPAGNAIFTGVEIRDGIERPTWLYSTDEVNALALWKLAPNSLKLITEDGQYSSDAPALPPTVTFTVTDDGAIGAVSSVKCRYNGEAQYSMQYADGHGIFSDWTTWSPQQTREFTLEEGERVQLRAKARCVSKYATTPESAVSDTVSYARPITTVFASPQLTVTDTGEITWSLVNCTVFTIPEYQVQTRINGAPWAPWTPWSDSKSVTVTVGEGDLVEAQVRARCASEFVEPGPPSATGYASTIVPIISVPATPTVTLAGTDPVHVTVSEVTGCPVGTTVQYSTRHASNQTPTGAWSSWANNRVKALHGFDEGTRAHVQAKTRCHTPYATGPESDPSSTATIVVPVTSVPGQPVVTLAPNGSHFLWTDSRCPTGTDPEWQWHYTANAGTRIVGTEWLPNPDGVPVTVNEGGTLQVELTGRCAGPAATGPASATRVWNIIRPITTVPTAPLVTLHPALTASWSTSGCPTGTVPEFQWRRSLNGGAYGGHSVWTTHTTITAQGNAGDTVYLRVAARCTNYDTNQYGPASTETETGRTRAVDAPARPGSIVRANLNYYGIRWSAVSCPAGTRPEYTTHFTRPYASPSAPAVSRWAQHNGGRDPVYVHPTSLPIGGALSYKTHSRCINDATGIASAWTTRDAYWGGNSSNASGVPYWY